MSLIYLNNKLILKQVAAVCELISYIRYIQQGLVRSNGL